MKLSIIIPTLNESDNLTKILPYLQSEVPKSSVKVVVVDADRSKDNSLSVCKKHDVNYVKSTHSQRAAQMNEGARHFPSDAYFFLHADVFPPNGFYDIIRKTLTTGHSFGLFAYWFDEKKWALNTNAFFTKFDGIFCGGGDQCHFITRETFDSIGGYCVKHNIMEDFNLFHKIKKLRIPYQLREERATVSARKYKHNSYLRVNMVNAVAFVKYFMKVQPDKIKSFYGKWLHT